MRVCGNSCLTLLVLMSTASCILDAAEAARHRTRTTTTTTSASTAATTTSELHAGRRSARQQRQCWDAFDTTRSSTTLSSNLNDNNDAFLTAFLELGASAGQEQGNLTSIEQVRSLCEAAKEYENSGGTSIMNTEQRRGCEALTNLGAVPDLHSGFDINLYGPLWNAFPKMAGALFGRSIFSGCKCEACVYSLDTLIMYLDEDTLGFFNENDINRVLMDRFCYGLKWMYRSACHHIMSDYYPQVVDMLQKYLTGWDVCRHLRFCPWAITNNAKQG